MRSFLHAKSMAKSLRQDLANRNLQLSHGECLEMVARQFGLNDWNTLAAHIGDVSPSETKLAIPKIGRSPDRSSMAARTGLGWTLPSRKPRSSKASCQEMVTLS